MLLLPYKQGSKSARAIAEALGIKQVALANNNAGRFARRPQQVINWGNSTYPLLVGCTYINRPESIAKASNKLTAFQVMRDAGVEVPAFTTDKAEALNFLRGNKTVVERHKLTGHSGEGIRLVRNDNELQDAPLYVSYVPKNEEFRVHVMKGTVIHVQRKARRREVPAERVNWQVRNLAGGFIYEVNLTQPVSQFVLDQAVKAVNALGLDFGAVDVVQTIGQDIREAVVLEVNTACGVEGTTLERYVEALKRVRDGLQPAPWVHPLGVNGIRAPRAPQRVAPEPVPVVEELVAEEVPDLVPPQPAVNVVEPYNIMMLRLAVEGIENVDPIEIRGHAELLRNLVVKLNTIQRNIMLG